MPEGVQVASVNYAALLGPALAWPGLALLVWRINIIVLRRRTGRFASDRAGRAPELAAAAVRRRYRAIARGAAGLAVALGLAASTALFTTTYDKQARLDVALTVGADVAVTEPSGAAVAPAAGQALLAASSVSAVEPLQHRLAYVGADLQDLYGIRPATIGKVAPLLDSFVPGSTISRALQGLSRTPDGALLSAETIRDYQLHSGDLVNLRLQSGTDHVYRQFRFHVIGVVKEFPTAPKDSFIIANAAYVTRITGSDAVGTFLIRSRHPTATAAALRGKLPAGAQIHDVVSDRNNVPSASGLASSDLAGLSRLELGFGLLLALCLLGAGPCSRHRRTPKRVGPARCPGCECATARTVPDDRGSSSDRRRSARGRGNRRRHRLSAGEGPQWNLRSTSDGTERSACLPDRAHSQPPRCQRTRSHGHRTHRRSSGTPAIARPLILRACRIEPEELNRHRRRWTKQDGTTA